MSDIQPRTAAEFEYLATATPHMPTLAERTEALAMLHAQGRTLEGNASTPEMQKAWDNRHTLANAATKPTTPAAPKVSAPAAPVKPAAPAVAAAPVAAAKNPTQDAIRTELAFQENLLKHPKLARDSRPKVQQKIRELRAALR